MRLAARELRLVCNDELQVSRKLAYMPMRIHSTSFSISLVPG